MSRGLGLVFLAALFLVGCQGSSGPVAKVDGESIGPRVAVGSTRRLSLPPTQYERMHFLTQAGEKIRILVRGQGAAPLSLSVFPVIARDRGRYQQPTASFTLKPFQRTAPLPLDTVVVVPTDWQPRDAIVVELKNIGSTVVEPEVEIRSS